MRTPLLALAFLAACASPQAIPEAPPPPAAPAPPPAPAPSPTCPAGRFFDGTSGCATCPRWLTHSEVLGWCTHWAPVGELAEERSDHTATLLPDGRVLVAGGRTSTGPTTTTALFDPATDSWTDGPDLQAARTAHTATLLADGRVLVAGGQGAGGPLASAELFDPQSPRWVTSGAMRDPRSDHAAALLADGRVMLVAGSGTKGALPTVELFDPASGAFTRLPSLPDARRGPSAHALADGSVVVVGGEVPPQRRRSSIVDALPAAEGTARVLRYAPAGERWETSAELPQPVGRHVAVAAGDLLILVPRPRAPGSDQLQRSILLHDARIGISRAEGIPGGEGPPAIALSAGGAVIAWSAPDPMTDTRRRGPAGSVWVPLVPGHQAAELAPMVGRRRGHTLTALADGRLLLVGGTLDVAQTHRSLILVALQGLRRGRVVDPTDPQRAPAEAASRRTLESLRARLP